MPYRLVADQSDGKSRIPGCDCSQELRRGNERAYGKFEETGDELTIRNFRSKRRGGPHAEVVNCCKATTLTTHTVLPFGSTKADSGRKEQDSAVEYAREQLHSAYGPQPFVRCTGRLVGEIDTNEPRDDTA